MSCTRFPASCASRAHWAMRWWTGLQSPRRPLTPAAGRSDDQPMTRQDTIAALLALAAAASVAQRLGTGAFLRERSLRRGPR
jgi:hypothetical protein